MIFDRQDEQVCLVMNGSTCPAFNLAAEEYFLCRREENYILLWRNEPSIIIGRNQNAYAELDVEYVREHNIPVIRRLTGGGAVFHDLGNLNFTFIKNGQDGMADFREFLEPVTGYLRSLGLNAEFSGRNDILVDGMKISGNAQTNIRGRVMLHGTLLFDASLDTLTRALKPNPLKLAAKGIKSVKSRVTNIKTHISDEMTVDDLACGLAQYLTAVEKCKRLVLDEQDIKEIEILVRDKYNTFTWNFGSAPPYSVEKSVKFDGGIISANMDIKNGIIVDLRLFGDFFGNKSVEELESKLKKTPYEPSAVQTVLEGIELEKYIAGVKLNDFTRLLF